MGDILQPIASGAIRETDVLGDLYDLLGGVVAVLVMLLANRRSVMHNKANGLLLNIAGWATTSVMSVAAVAVVLISPS